MGWWPCGGCGDFLDECDGACTGTVDVVFPAATNVGCGGTGCADLAGTYTLTNATGCGWSLTTTNPVSCPFLTDPTNAQFQLSVDSTGFLLSVSWSGFVGFSIDTRPGSFKNGTHDTVPQTWINGSCADPVVLTLTPSGENFYGAGTGCTYPASTTFTIQ